MITVEKAQQLLGQNIPHDREFLELLDDVVKDHGEEWTTGHAAMLISQWSYVSTLVKDDAKSVLRAAIAEGGRKVRCYDGLLPSYYKQFGFKETRRVKWDDLQAPPKGWNRADGKPDTVFMEIA